MKKFLKKTVSKLKKLSIRYQLILIIVSITTLTLIFSISFSIYLSINNLKRDIKKSASLQAKLVGEYCISPLIFRDKKGAEEILKKLKQVPSVEKAVLFDEADTIFAIYSKKTTDNNFIPYKNKKFIKTEKQIIFNNKIIGKIILYSNTNKLSNEIIALFLNNIFLFFLALLFSYLLAILFQKVLSKPILNLSKASQKFARGEPVDLTSLEKTNKEIEILISSFSEMIKKIEERERKLSSAIEALKESESKYKRFFEHDVSAILIFLPNGTILDCNSTFKTFFGFNDKEDVKKINFHSLCKDRNCFDEVKRELFETKKIINKEIQMISSSKEVKTLLANFFTEKTKEGQNSIVAYLFDITQRKRYEEQFFHSQKMASIGTFVGGIAHDFNNILTAIKGYSEITLKIVGKGSKIYKSLKRIDEASKKAENLIKKLLFISKKEVTRPAIIDINKLICELKGMLERLIGEDIDLKTELTENLPPIYADQTQIEQVIINLVANSRDALKLTKKRKKEILIETKFLKIEESFKNDLLKKGDYIVLSISDNGIGMDEEVKEKAFEPFFTTKEKGKGTGLGLSTVFGVIQQNNGVINLYSEKNIGTTIKIYLPAYYKEGVKIVKTKEKKQHKHLKNKKILVVEDDKDVRDFSVSVLEDLGYEVFYSTNGKEGLSFINDKGKVDLIFTDIIMPEMNGYNFIEEVKKIYPDIKVIFTSGYTDGYLIDQGQMIEGINFLPKPFSYEALSEIVAKVMSEE